MSSPPAAVVTGADPAPPAPYAPGGPRKSLWAVRVVAVLHALVVLAQPVLAGFFLDGDVDAIVVHEGNAHLAVGMAFFLGIAGIVYAWPGGGRWWPALAGLGFLLLEEAQTGFGYGRILAVHIPLGVLLVVVALAFAAWTFRASARRLRRARKAGPPENAGPQEGDA